MDDGPEAASRDFANVNNDAPTIVGSAKKGSNSAKTGSTATKKKVKAAKGGKNKQANEERSLVW
jgi:hypothetical protein